MERDSLQELGRRLTSEVRLLNEAIEQGLQENARDHARVILSLGSKAHQRLGILVDIARDARWHAAVDRAVKSAPSEVPGQMSIVDAVKARPSVRKPRKPKA